MSVVPVPSVLEKYGLPNPVDLIIEERLRVVMAVPSDELRTYC